MGNPLYSGTEKKYDLIGEVGRSGLNYREVLQGHRKTG